MSIDEAQVVSEGNFSIQLPFSLMASSQGIAENVKMKL